MAQNGAAIAQIGADIEKIVRRIADIVFPKRHHLHQTARAHSADGILAKRAFHFNQTQNHLGVESGATAFVLNIDQQTAALALIGNKACQSGRHRRQPTFPFLRICKHQPRRAGTINRTAHHGSHIIRQRFFTLRPSPCGRRRQKHGSANLQHTAAR